MSGRASAGISQQVSSRRTSSDVENDTAVPATSLLLELQAVERDRLDQVARAVATTCDGSLESAVAESSSEAMCSGTNPAVSARKTSSLSQSTSKSAWSAPVSSTS